MELNTLIFDIGNVLVRQRFDELAAETASNEEEYQVLKNKIFGGPVWPLMDRGVLSNEEELDALIALSPQHEAAIRRLYENLGDCVRIYDGTMEWIRELKGKGYRIYALSNWVRKVYEQRGHNLDFLEEMDGYLLSHEIHKVKPDAEYYQLLLDTYGIVPEQAVFLDDLEKNVRAAEALGIHGIVVQSREQAKQELAKLGVV